MTEERELTSLQQFVDQVVHRGPWWAMSFVIHAIALWVMFQWPVSMAKEQVRTAPHRHWPPRHQTCRRGWRRSRTLRKGTGSRSRRSSNLDDMRLNMSIKEDKEVMEDYLGWNRSARAAARGAATAAARGRAMAYDE